MKKKRAHDSDSLAARIAHARQLVGWSQTELGKAVKVSRGAVGQWESGTTSPSSDNLRHIAAATGVSLNWLANNKGAMRPDNEDYHLDSSEVLSELPSQGRHSQGIQELDVRAGMGGGGVPSIEVRRDGNHADAIKPDLWFLPAPFVRHELRAKPKDVIIVETQGDSMSPTIEPGERVFVDTSHRIPTPDGVYAIRDGFGALVVKRLQAVRGKRRMLILSDNKSHHADEVGLDEIEVIGKVVGAIKRF